MAADLDAELGRIDGAPFELVLEGVGSFGEGRDVRAVWAGMAPKVVLEATHEETLAIVPLGVLKDYAV